MRIDDHIHPDYYSYSAEKLVENMDQFGIDKSWLLTWEAPIDEVDPANRRCATPKEWAIEGPLPLSSAVEYKNKFPDRFILGFAPDPRRPESIDRLNSALNLYDVRIYGELKIRMMFDNPDAIAMYRFCGEKKLPVLVHIDYPIPYGYRYPRPNWWYGGSMEAFERAIKLCPETNFIGHAPGFWAHISGDDLYKTVSYPTGPVLPNGKLIQMLDTYPNLYCDISAGSGCNALSRDLEFTKKFLVNYQDRILYGRDYYDNVHQELLDSLGLPKEVLDKIYGLNALKLVPLN
jgi:predicted TIM-barrel fold metal-dependent hydrolase